MRALAYGIYVVLHLVTWIAAVICGVLAFVGLFVVLAGVGT